MTLGKKNWMTRFWFDFLKDVFDSVLNTSPHVFKMSVSIVCPTVHGDILSVYTLCEIVVYRLLFVKEPTAWPTGTKTLYYH